MYDLFQMQIPGTFYVTGWHKKQQKLIEKTEKDDFSEVQSLLRILSKSFEDEPEADEAGYASAPPRWARNKGVSCSTYLNT